MKKPYKFKKGKSKAQKGILNLNSKTKFTMVKIWIQRIIIFYNQL